MRPVGHKALLEDSLVRSSVTLVTGDSASHSHPLVLYGVARDKLCPSGPWLTKPNTRENQIRDAKL